MTESPGRVLRRRRRALGLNQRDAAALIACHPSSLSNIEVGTMRAGPALLLRAAAALGLDADGLMALHEAQAPRRG